MVFFAYILMIVLDNILAVRKDIRAMEGVIAVMGQQLQTGQFPEGHTAV